MLNKDPNQRPTIHKILQAPEINKRITRFLQAEVFKEEFAHTLLHNQNVFEQFKMIQAEKKAKADAEEEKKKQAEEMQKQQERLAKMQIQQQQFNPPQSYMEMYKDPSVFNEQYSKYVQHLAQEEDTQSTSTAAFNQQ